MKCDVDIRVLSQERSTVFLVLSLRRKIVPVALLLVAFAGIFVSVCEGWVINTGFVLDRNSVIAKNTVLFADPIRKVRKQSRSSTIQPTLPLPDIRVLEKEATTSSTTITNTISTTYVDEDKPAGIVGAEFFGGSKQKEEFFDPIAEMEAAQLVGVASTVSLPTITLNDDGVMITTNTTAVTIVDHEINRFYEIEGAFDTTITATIAHDIQQQINSVLYNDNEYEGTTIRDVTYMYPDSMTKLEWNTPFTKTTGNPLLELEKCLNFFNRIDVAVISGKQVPNTKNMYEMRYEVAVTWPTIWEPRVLLTGSSMITIDEQTKQIVKQVDTLDNDLFVSIVQQLVPRFWDLYHIGMAPSSEVSPNLKYNNNGKQKSFSSSYKIQKLPPRLYLRPTIRESNDKSNRENNSAAFVPNHSYSTAIITMGPLKQRYSTASPLSVQILPSSVEKNQLEISWEIPLSVEYASNIKLLLPPPDNDSLIEPNNQGCQYIYRPERIIATVPYYAGEESSPQDESIVAIRKKLYEQTVIQDGFQPCLDSFGRPKFLFIQNNVKACYTEKGLGMSVYAWRPRFAGTYEIGIELEMCDGSASAISQLND